MKIKTKKIILPKVNLYAVEILLALGLLGIGIGMLSIPAALITLGGLVLIDVIWGAARR